MMESIYTDLHKLYYQTIIAILNISPDAKFKIIWSNHNEFLYDVEIPQLKGIDNLLNILKSKQLNNNLTLVSDKLSMSEFLNRLNETNQTQHQELYNNYFIYGKYFTKNPDEIYFIDKIKQVLKLGDLDWFDRNLIDIINYSFYKFKEIKINLLRLIEADFKNTYSLEINIYLTNLFICINSLIDNLKNKGYPIQEAINRIEFNTYQRYKRKESIVDINSILDLINHFRDAVCHRETKDNNKITKPVNSKARSIMMLSGEGLNCKIRYGDGILSVNKQLIPLIKCMKELLIPKELSVISIVDNKGKVIFCDLANEDESFPLRKGLYVSHISENKLRIHFPIG